MEVTSAKKARIRFDLLGRVCLFGIVSLFSLFLYSRWMNPNLWDYVVQDHRLEQGEPTILDSQSPDRETILEMLNGEEFSSTRDEPPAVHSLDLNGDGREDVATIDFWADIRLAGSSRNYRDDGESVPYDRGGISDIDGDRFKDLWWSQNEFEVEWQILYGGKHAGRFAGQFFRIPESFESEEKRHMERGIFFDVDNDGIQDLVFTKSKGEWIDRKWHETIPIDAEIRWMKLSPPKKQ